MTHLLDTNVVVGFLKGHRQIIARMRFRPLNELGLSAIVMAELWFGAFQSRQANALMQRLQKIGLPILPFGTEDAVCTGEVRAFLGRSGNSIGPYDGLIAGHALARNLTLVTHNTREFSRVPGLRIEDWEL